MSKLKDWQSEAARGTAGGRLQSMADTVAQAIYRSVMPPDASEGWIDLTETERNDFRLAAHAAMGAHDAWLTLNGWIVVKVEDAKADAPRLALPLKAALLGPDGRPIN